MKTARFLLACAVASVLAACGNTITAPTDAHRAAPPKADESTSSTPCVTKNVVLSDGSTVEVCVQESGSQMGTGS
ncbi:MAG TPA: hypothetical protein VFJ16_21165 [Longimicrobium sp.]|nr:hypothetical protein [Longimicrobium sp.]